MQAGQVVRHMPTGRIGVVATDIMGCCDDNEEPVVYDGGGDAFVGTDSSELEAIGKYGDPQFPANASPERCGAGEESCCIYLICGPNGFSCGRFDAQLRNQLKFSPKRAKREPSRLFTPNCQLPISQ